MALDVSTDAAGALTALTEDEDPAALEEFLLEQPLKAIIPVSVTHRSKTGTCIKRLL